MAFSIHSDRRKPAKHARIPAGGSLASRTPCLLVGSADENVKSLLLYRTGASYRYPVEKLTGFNRRH